MRSIPAIGVLSSFILPFYNLIYSIYLYLLSSQGMLFSLEVILVQKMKRWCLLPFKLKLCWEVGTKIDILSTLLFLFHSVPFGYDNPIHLSGLYLLPFLFSFSFVLIVLLPSIGQKSFSLLPTIRMQRNTNQISRKSTASWLEWKKPMPNIVTYNCVDHWRPMVLLPSRGK